MRSDHPNPHLIERTERPGFYVAIPGLSSRYYTSSLPDAMRFSPAQAAAWALPHERIVPLEQALQSLAS